VRSESLNQRINNKSDFAYNLFFELSFVKIISTDFCGNAVQAAVDKCFCGCICCRRSSAANLLGAELLKILRLLDLCSNLLMNGFNIIGFIC